MKKDLQTVLFLIVTALLSAPLQAAEITADNVIPPVRWDPIIQQLKLSDAQLDQIQILRQQLIHTTAQLKAGDDKGNTMMAMFNSGKWDETLARQQSERVTQRDEQVRYYRLKYYFDVSQVLTPVQRQRVSPHIIRNIDQ